MNHSLKPCRRCWLIIFLLILLPTIGTAQTLLMDRAGLSSIFPEDIDDKRYGVSPLSASNNPYRESQVVQSGINPPADIERFNTPWSQIR